MANPADPNMVDRLNIQVPQTTKEILKKLANEHGTDLTGYLNAVVFTPIIKSYHERTIGSNPALNSDPGRYDGGQQKTSS
jgi:hypothetical protein